MVTGTCLLPGTPTGTTVAGRGPRGAKKKVNVRKIDNGRYSFYLVFYLDIGNISKNTNNKIKLFNC